MARSRMAAGRLIEHVRGRLGIHGPEDLLLQGQVIEQREARPRDPLRRLVKADLVHRPDLPGKELAQPLDPDAAGQPHTNKAAARVALRNRIDRDQELLARDGGQGIEPGSHAADHEPLALLLAPLLRREPAPDHAVGISRGHADEQIPLQPVAPREGCGMSPG